MEWMVSPAVLFALLNVIIVALILSSSARRNRGGNADAAEQRQHLSSKLTRFLSRNFSAKQIPYQAAPRSSNDPSCETLQPMNDREEKPSRESLQNTEQIPATASSEKEKPFRRASSREVEKSDTLPLDEEGSQTPTSLTEMVKDKTEGRVTEAGSTSGKPRVERRSSSEIKSKSAGRRPRKPAAEERLKEDVSGESSDLSVPLPPPVPPAMGSESLFTRLVSFGRRSGGDANDEQAAESHTAQVDADAENFIRRFKNQLKLQRYQSLLRYKNTTGT